MNEVRMRAEALFADGARDLNPRWNLLPAQWRRRTSQNCIPM